MIDDWSNWIPSSLLSVVEEPWGGVKRGTAAYFQVGTASISNGPLLMTFGIKRWNKWDKSPSLFDGDGKRN